MATTAKVNSLKEVAISTQFPDATLGVGLKDLTSYANVSTDKTFSG